jgi:hypothetical protein
MDWLSTVGNLASIAGLVLSAVILVFAKRAEEAAREARTAARKGNATEVLARIGDTANLLLGCLENNQQNEMLVRARDLISEISRFKLRYDQFLDSGSKARLDEARQQVSVISRSVSSRGLPQGPSEKKQDAKDLPSRRSKHLERRIS